MATKKKTEHYVDNKEFLEAMKEYKKLCRKAKREKQPNPPVTDYIGGCFLKIANHLSYRPNFINYTFRDDMISDGIENCLQYLNNFDPEKSNNPFAYFTQIIWFAFLRRIQKEKKHLYVKYKLTENVNVMQMAADKQAHDVGGNFDDSVKHSEWSNEYMSNFISDFEENKRRKVEKREKK